MTLDEKMDLEGDTVRIGQTGSTTRTLGELLGSGQEGEVYQIEGSDNVAKIFYEEYRAEKEEKIPAMIENAPTGVSSDIRDRTSVVWPETVIRDTRGSFVGYGMPYLDLDTVRPVNQYVGEELQWGPSDFDDRYEVAQNFAIAIHRIHDEGHGVGDWNHDNFLVTDDRRVILVDCDAFHTAGDKREYEGKTFLPKYTPPEGARDDKLRKVRKADRFSLGVHIFNIVMEGIHPYLAEGEDAVAGDFEDMIQGNERFPYANPDPGRYEPHSRAPDYDQLASEIKDKFDSCFNRTGKRLGWGRPSAIEWAKTFADLRGVSIQGITDSVAGGNGGNAGGERPGSSTERDTDTETETGSPFGDDTSETGNGNPFGNDTSNGGTGGDSESAARTGSPFDSNTSTAGSESPTDSGSSDNPTANPFREDKDGDEKTTDSSTNGGDESDTDGDGDPWSNRRDGAGSESGEDESDDKENPFRK
ncbi:hypothetical protein [Halosimplex sp. TS25]|uniref:hypothetical protein n=1 Tax=Halosimplex rarum TaxID=3396619 RepID=UPI0039E8C163